MSLSVPEDFDLTPGRNQSFIIYPNIAFDPNRCLLLNLSIIDDNIALEGTESVLFELSDEESQVGLGEQTNTTVLITDGDGEHIVILLCIMYNGIRTGVI